ncbi:DUF3040 domain-containing protein [Demequina sp.]|uniref:DUF3040 domain-containing protein n=1 Tax=Demequina sp. TaxID=2050685 RepID=UPI003D1337D5
MPLSEYEQRVLEQMERDLGADTKLNSAMAKTARPRGRWTFAFIGIVAGLGVLIAGAIAQLVVVGVLGFALMLAAALWGMLAPAKKAPTAAAAKGDAKGGTARKAKRQGFMNRVEERFERRRDQNDF